MSLAAIKTIQAQTNESKVRLVAFFVLLLTCVYWFTGSVFIPVFLVADFGLRSFNLGKFSPLALLSDWLIRSFKLPVKPVYLPPKRFAARIGLVFATAILLLHVIKINTIIFSGTLAVFAALESLAGFCAGCYVYNFLQRFRKQV
jgi:hypothetical protein